MFKKTLLYSLGGTLGFLVLLFGFATNKASAATLTLTPTTGSVSVGQTINVDIMLDTQGVAVDGVDVYSLHYNQNVLEVQDASSSTSGVQITAGTLLPLTLTNIVSNGLINFSQVTTGGSTYTGAGKLATITFKGIFNGSSNLTIDYTAGSTSDSNVAGGGVDRLTGVGSSAITVSGGTQNPNPTPPPPAPPAPNPTPPPPPPTPTPTPSPGPTPTPPPPPGTLPADGILIKDSTGPAIYVMEYGKKRPFVSFAVFTGWSYKVSNIQIMNTSSIPLGPGVFTTSQRHVRGSLVLLNGTVYFMGALIKYPFPSAAVFLSWGNQFKNVVVGSSYDSQVTTGAIVQMKP